MKTQILFALLILGLVACDKTPKQETSSQEQESKLEPDNLTYFLVGSYTDTNSEGIYRYGIDESGQLLGFGLVAKADNPSFLTRSKDGKYVLSVSEVRQKDTGRIISFEETPSGDSLIAINSAISAGTNPCYITTNDAGYVLTANYSGGNMSLHRLNDNGELSDVLDVQQHEGSGSHVRQDKPHAHSCRFVEGTNTIVAADLGTNELWISELDTVNHQISDEVSKLPMAENAGPRHLEFHPNGDWIYIINELDATVSQVAKGTDGYEVISTVSTLPSDYSETNKCADIHISQDGKFLYGSNRGHNSIVIYEVNSDTGNLNLLGYESTRGETPRNFAISPDGNYLLVANKDTNNLVSFKRDQNTGLLSFASEIEAFKPVCILF